MPSESARMGLEDMVPQYGEMFPGFIAGSCDTCGMAALYTGKHPAWVHATVDIKTLASTPIDYEPNHRLTVDGYAGLRA